MSGELESLPFDQYPRYRLVAELATAAAGDLAGRSVLDVGGASGVLARFLPSARVVAVDLERGAAPLLVQGDGVRLPFRDRAFELVVAVDTLEHIPPAQRRAFVSECVRVTQSWVLLVGPYAAPRVAAAEDILRQFLTATSGGEHRFLAEHKRHGLPQRSEVERQLSERDGRIFVRGHGQLERWLAAMALELYADRSVLLRPLLGAWRRFYNAALYEADGAEPHYRHALLAAFGGARLPSFEPSPAPPAPSAAAEGASGAFLRQVLAFDSEREVWAPELERLTAAAAALEHDLCGHREVLAETRAELTRHQKALRELGATRERERGEARAVELALRGELAEHARVLATLTGTHERVLREARGQRIELDARSTELSSHAANVERERDAIRGQYSGLSARFDDLHAELQLELEQGRQRAQELARARREGEWLVASLGERDERLDELTQRLGSRWDALLRLLWLRRGV